MSTQTFTVKDASRLSGLPSSTLRYYESIGIIKPIQRDASSRHRVYSQDDIHIIDAIACLNATGMSLGDMKLYLENRTKGADGADDEIALLEAQQERLENEARFLQLRRQYVVLKVAYWKAIKAGDEKQAARIGSDARELAQTLKFPT